MAKLFPPGYQFADSGGNPIAGGTVSFYQTGTTTAKNIYTDTALSAAATNPAPLDSAGRFTQGDLYGSGPYTVVLKDAASGQIWSRDSVEPVGDVNNVTRYDLGSIAATMQHPGIATGHIIEITYNDTNFVIGSGGVFRYDGTSGSTGGVGPLSDEAGNWPYTDGYFYDIDAKRFVKISRWGEIVTATNVITAAESGTTFYLNSATEFVSTLPVPLIGLWFRFVVKAAPSGASYTIVTNASANIIHGQICSAEDAAGSVSTVAASDTISFVDGKAIIGDWVEVESDGTNWYVSGMCNVQDGITTSQVS